MQAVEATKLGLVRGPWPVGRFWMRWRMISVSSPVTVNTGCFDMCSSGLWACACPIELELAEGTF